MRGTINGFPFRSSLSPYGGIHYLPVRESLRQAARVRAGETVTLILERDDKARVVIPPRDFAQILKKNKAAYAAWQKSSYTYRKEVAQAIKDAKTTETRKRRIQKALAELSAKNIKTQRR